MDTEVILADKKISEIKGCFVVRHYQRGYRWGKQQVETLLDDISRAMASDKVTDYWLQPIVLKKLPPDGETPRYELIDGQQRLTTIYILLSFMKRNAVQWLQLNFTLEYETRPDTAGFLDNMTEEGAEDHIDFWHIYNAGRYIDAWFKRVFENDANKIGAGQNKLYSYMVEHLKVIWYEAGSDEDSNKMFTRLNIGRIKLTNAELIKALFLQDGSKSDETYRTRLEMSMQWDSMEKQLNSGNDELWYFLTKETPDKYPTRIELLFDLMAGKKPDEPEEYYTFFWFADRIKTETVKKCWDEIVNKFLRIKEWYEDNRYYHKIGYLISSGSACMADIFDIANGKRKSEFVNCLDERIKRSIDIDAKSIADYIELSYDKAREREVIGRLLLLFNIESILAENIYQRFPFGKYNTAEWSLEHIHAQQSQGLRTMELQKEWLKMHLPSLKAVYPTGEEDALINEVATCCSADYRLTSSSFADLFDRVVAKLSDGGDLEYLHSLSNMALLAKGDNAALRNSTFDVKRNCIVDMDRKGAFIPYCTKMVFLKYYTPSADNQVHFWGEKDREAYINAIVEKLSPFMSVNSEEV
ncbi:MAG: DUF262 domain-containing protein [Kiritimatiellae bacterium]|nr:DUF262 domain-containing protein [Kiritimatiellia bacterium]